MKTPAAMLFLSFSMLGATAWSQTPVPEGAEFQVNSYTTFGQFGPSVSVDADGDFVVVWHSTGSSGTDISSSSVQGQFFDLGGAAQGSEFQINTYTLLAQNIASLAVEPDGDFVVVWQSQGSSGTDTWLSSIQGQRFKADSEPEGAEFQVNTYTTSGQYAPSVAVEADGDFIVVWRSNGSDSTDTDSFSSQGQRFNADGTLAGAQFQVNTYTTNSQYNLSVGVKVDGSFVVVWDSYGSSNTDTDGSIQGQLYNPVGITLGDEFRINTYTTNGQSIPAVAVNADGSFVVTWSSVGSSGTDTSSSSIQGQRFNAAGTAIGDEFQVNTYTTGAQTTPSVEVDADAGFAVVWRSNESGGPDTSFASIQGQRYEPAGTPVGTQFEVNTYTTNSQMSPNVGMDADGDFVVVWDSAGSYGTDNSFASIQGQRLATPISLAGMESGDLSEWSSVFPPPGP